MGKKIVCYHTVFALFYLLFGAMSVTISKSLQSYDDDGVVSVTCWPTRRSMHQHC